MAEVQHFKTNDTGNSMLEFSDLMPMEINCDNLRGFDTEWAMIFLA